jgi:hypothetical protein
MREREVGGYEPDDKEQHELFKLWHMSRTAIALPGPERQALFDKHGGERGARIAWIVDEFLKAHAGEPNVARKWIYVWCEAVLGRPIEARTVTMTDAWGHKRVVGGFGDVGIAKPRRK